MLDLLIEGDHVKCRKFWAEKMSGFPQPASDEEAEVVMHQARTMSVIPLNLRLWSHNWLADRGLPSQLPEDLKPKAKTLRPIKVQAVGLSVSSAGPVLEGAAQTIRKDMESAVLDMLSAGGQLPSPEVIRRRLREVSRLSHRKLFGRDIQ